MQVKNTQILRCVEAFLAIIHKFDIWEQNREHTRNVTLSRHLLTCIHVHLCQNILNSHLSPHATSPLLQRSIIPSYTQVWSYSNCLYFFTHTTFCSFTMNMIQCSINEIAILIQYFPPITSSNILWPCCVYRTHWLTKKLLNYVFTNQYINSQRCQLIHKTRV